MNQAVAGRTPAHLWIVGVFALLWSAVSANDYIQTQMGNLEYLASVGAGPEEIDWIDAMPLWAEVSWALAVWCAVLGALLLLLRNGMAAPAYAVSLAGVVVLTAWQYLLPHPAMVEQMPTVVFMVVLVVVAIALFVYARRMRAGGVLR